MSEIRLAGVYCTIVAQNYLPQALALYESVRKHEPERDFVLLVVDGDRRELELDRPRLTVLGRNDLGIEAIEYDYLAMIYDVVELSTSVKPLLLRQLLNTYEQAIYLDPDMQVVSPLVELEPAVREHGVVLTPHFLKPIPPGSSYISEVHSLTVGVHNLGFCAVGRGGRDFLDWWWAHLERECLIYPLLGMFVDQKWTDVGANYFGAHSLRHAGYNVGPWNLLERHIDRDTSQFIVGEDGHHLRLLHFSGFNANDPEAISERLNADMHNVTDSAAFRDLSRDYARTVLRIERELGSTVPYGFNRDSRGKSISKRLRRQYRADLLSSASATPLPSAFAPQAAEPFSAWRRSARVRKLGLAAGDLAIAAKYALPDTFGWFKRTFPKRFKSSRERLLSAANVRR
ncbi:hypothetical protein [Microbacterium hibisci]|uniref:hypothetical protein n=1 Tax=Microbacterium hibisci TaxID=2036000 RepID=UPI00194326B2|nr:hypothetical protein [Microbacterium hibisci]